MRARISVRTEQKKTNLIQTESSSIESADRRREGGGLPPRTPPHPATRRPGGTRPSHPDPPHPSTPPPGWEAALPLGPPHRATRRPPNPATQQPVGKRPHATPLAVALAFISTPSRCAARRNSGPCRNSSDCTNLADCKSRVHFDGRALRCSSKIWAVPNILCSFQFGNL